MSIVKIVLEAMQLLINYSSEATITFKLGCSAVVLLSFSYMLCLEYGLRQPRNPKEVGEDKQNQELGRGEVVT